MQGGASVSRRRFVSRPRTPSNSPIASTVAPSPLTTTSCPSEQAHSRPSSCTLWCTHPHRAAGESSCSGWPGVGSVACHCTLLVPGVTQCTAPPEDKWYTLPSLWLMATRPGSHPGASQRTGTSVNCTTFLMVTLLTRSRPRHKGPALLKGALSPCRPRYCARASQAMYCDSPSPNAPRTATAPWAGCPNAAWRSGGWAQAGGWRA